MKKGTKLIKCCGVNMRSCLVHFNYFNDDGISKKTATKIGDYCLVCGTFKPKYPDIENRKEVFGYYCRKNDGVDLDDDPMEKIKEMEFYKKFHRIGSYSRAHHISNKK